MKKDADKKRKTITIICSIIAFVLITVAAFFITKALNPDSVSTADFLVAEQSWQKSDEASVVWSFSSDGTCKITTNSTETFDCSWQLIDNNLKIQTNWLKTLSDEFEIEINKSDNSFTVTSKTDNKVSTFNAKN